MDAANRTLILTLTSKFKAGNEDGGFAAGSRRYDDCVRGAVWAKVPARRAELFEKRRYVLLELKNSNLQWFGRPIRDHTHNRNLVCGADFGGEEPAQYLTVADRHTGGFLAGWTPEDKQLTYDPRRRPDHLRFAFLSGMYGLLTPSEPV